MPKKARKKESSSESSLENARQLMHVLVGLGCAAVLVHTSLDVFRNFILGLLFIGIVLALLARAKKISVLARTLAMVERPHEGVPGQGAFLFLIGVGIPAFAFSNPGVVLTSIVALTFQDAFSTLVGKKMGKTKLGEKKTLEGAIGGWVACTIGLATFQPLPSAVVIALGASLVELLPLDDAITIPLVAAGLAYLF